MFLGLNFREDILYYPILINDESHPVNSVIFPSHKFLWAPDSIGI